MQTQSSKLRLNKEQKQQQQQKRNKNKTKQKKQIKNKLLRFKKYPQPLPWRDFWSEPSPTPPLFTAGEKKKNVFFPDIVVNTIKIDCVSDLYTVTGCEEFLTLTHKILTRFVLCLISFSQVFRHEVSFKE